MKKLLGFLGLSSLILAGMWGVVRFTPVNMNLQLLEAATQIYPKDSTSFITIPFMYRGMSVKDRHLSTNVGLSPVEGDRYIVAATGSDSWLTHTGHIAEWHTRSGGTAQWYFYDPNIGYLTYVVDEGLAYSFNGSAWVQPVTEGAKGDTGPAGVDGAKGDTGAAGQDGAVGDTGPAGVGVPSGGVQGDIIYYDTDSWKVLPAGTNGWFLKTQGAAANPIWAVGGGGTISGSGTAGKLTMWTGTTAIGDSASSETDVVDAVTKKHTGSHTGTTQYIPMFTGTNSLGDSSVTDTMLRVKHRAFTITDPNTLSDTNLIVWGRIDMPITITEVYLTCKTDPDTEIAGDFIYVDSVINQANPMLINSFDTTAGLRDDTTIDTPNVATGKAVMMKFDATPIAAIKQVYVDIYYRYQ